MIFGKTIFKCLSMAMLAAVSLTSCHDDPLPGGSPGVEGEDAVISLRLSLPKMERYSRSDIPDGADSGINNLWVGIFNAGTRELTFSRVYEASELTLPAGSHLGATLKDIETKSGNSYIIAVANIDVNTGVSPRYSDGAKAGLRELLGAVETYDDYLAIAVVSPGPGSVSTPIGNLPMSGIYYEKPDEDPAEAIQWETLCDKPVYIPAGNSPTALPGAIHLRRLTSQIKFDISVAPSAGQDEEIISLEPYQWQVFNVPEITWLHERGDGTGAGLYSGDNPAGTTNAGDFITAIHENKEENYAPSEAYTSTYFTPSGNGHYTFDFWQTENKRVGLERCDDYSFREKRIDRNGNIHGGDEEGRYTESTEVYASLCNTAGEAFPNNHASYVRIKCRIKYKEKTTGDDPTYGHTGLEGAIRTADVTYTIHLGYVNNSGGIGSKARDFRSLRNSIYTYNVKVTDVKNMILEAYREGENQPGAEGTVADIKEKDFLLDAHYQEFNICFTEQELKEVSCLINAYYGGALQIVQGKSAGSDYNVIDQYRISSGNKKFWDWVEFRATDDKGKLAVYKPVGYDYAASEKQTFTLETLCGLFTRKEDGSEPVRNADFDKYVGNAIDGKYWFTVFVNENVYADENKREDPWPYFVNQSPRKLYINVKEAVASDGQTMYIQSKYAITQRSIQTYYSTSASTVTAMGLEHVNESFGLRLRWTNDNPPQADWDHTHGRSNLLRYLQVGNSPRWSEFVSVTEPFSTPEVMGSYAHAGNPEIREQSYTVAPAEAYLPGLQKISTRDVSGTNDWYADPVTWYGGGENEYYIHVLNACMNRNRDLDGDGVIDANEVRWYVPTSSRYLRMIIGSQSLETPLIDFTNTPYILASSQNTQGINNSNTRYHFATSDARIIWSEEGLAVSDWHKNGGSNGWIFGAWEVRCVRNLGTDFNDTNGNTDIQAAYTVNTGSRKIVMSHYDSRSVRDAYYTQTPAVHSLTSSLNRPYKAFEYDSRNLRVTGINNISGWYDMLKNHTDPCSQKGGNWRVPVMSELAILRSIYGGSDYSMKNDDTEDLFSVAQEGEVLLTCTKEYYSNYGRPMPVSASNNSDGNNEFLRFMGANYNQTYAVNVSDFLQGHTFWVRCVRDIQP